MEQYKEINGIGYTLVGDYYLPNLLPHQEAEVADFVLLDLPPLPLYLQPVVTDLQLFLSRPLARSISCARIID